MGSVRRFRNGLDCVDCSACPHFHSCSDVEMGCGRSAGREMRLSITDAPAFLKPSLLSLDGSETGGVRISMLDSDASGCDVYLAILDCMNLESSLLHITYLMDTGRKYVLVADRYEEFMATEHSVRFDVLSVLLGLPIVSSTGRPEAVMEAALEIHNNLLWLPRSIQGRQMDDEEHARLGFVTGALQETICHSSDDSKHTAAQKIDALLTNKWLGFPLLIIVLLALFQATFALGAYPQQWIEYGVDIVADVISRLFPSGWVSSLLTDGIVRGVGAVLAFVPNIMILFFFLSMLEDSGYMARAAYIMDKIMHRVGLHGNSFIPMLIGFGCNVPAIMAARGIQNHRDRVLTMLMIPFMSCSARLPVYMLFVSAFFNEYKGLIMLALYASGVILSILFAFVMKRSRFFRQKADDYVSELPPFHFPRMSDTFPHIWDRVKDYLQKISSVILAASVIIWALEYFPANRTDNGRIKEESALASIGRIISPVTEPLGFDWKMNVCLLTGLPAKEAIVSTVGIIYHTGDNENLVQTVRESDAFNVANSMAFLVFILLYFPCVATIATIRREAGRKWAVFTIINSNLLAWFVAFSVYRLALFLL